MAKFKKNSGSAVQMGRLYSYTQQGVSATEVGKISGLTASTTELNYMDGVTSAVRSQLSALNMGSTNIVTTNGAATHSMSSSSFNTVTSSAITINVGSTSSRVMYMCKANPHINTLTSTHRSAVTKVMCAGRDLGSGGGIQSQRNEIKHDGEYVDEVCNAMWIDHPNTTGNITYTMHQKTLQNGQICYAHEGLHADGVAMRFLVMEMNSGQTFSW